MTRQEALRRLNEFYSFVQNIFDNYEYYNSISESELSKIVDDKVEELSIFDIDFSQLTADDILFKISFEGETEERPLTDILGFITEEKKIQLLTNDDTNIVKTIEQLDILGDGTLAGNFLYALVHEKNFTDVEKIKIFREKFLNKSNYDAPFVQVISDFFDNLKEQGSKDIQDLWLDLTKPILSNLNSVGVDSIRYLFLKCPSDEFKSAIIEGLIDEKLLDSYDFNNIYSRVNDLDKKIEIARKAILYDVSDTDHDEIFLSSTLNDIFAKCDKVENEEQANYLTSRLLMMSQDEYLSNYVSPDIILSFFKTFNNDELLLNSFSKIIEEPNIRKKMQQENDLFVSFVELFGVDYQEKALRSYLDSGLHNLNDWNHLTQTLKVIKDDDLKNILISYNLEKGDYGWHIRDFLHVCFESINSIDKRLELAKKVMEYEEKQNKTLFESSMLSTIFTSPIRIDDKKQADCLVNKLIEVSRDEKFSSLMNGGVFPYFFSSFGKDQLLLDAFNEIVKEPELAQIINTSNDILLHFVSNFQDEKTKLQLLDQFIDKGNYKFNGFEVAVLFNNFSNKQLFLDYDLMKNIYSKIKFHEPIAYFCKEQNTNISSDDMRHIFKTEEDYYIENGKLKELLEKYRTVGIIDDMTISSVLEIGEKYIKGLTLEETFKRIGNSQNVKTILEQISMTPRNLSLYAGDPTIYETELQKFAAIFPRTRFGALPDLVSYNKMSLEMCSKFNIKTWNQLIQLPLFNKDDNTKRALVEVIAIAGLFESDPEVEIRKRQIINIFSKYDEPLKPLDVVSFGREEAIKTDDFLEQCQVKVYSLRDGVIIPEALSGMLQDNLSSKQFSKLMKKTGNTGSMITKFISPYAKHEGVWRLRTDVNIDNFTDYLKPEMTDEEYNRVLYSEATPKEVINFLNPFEEKKEEAFRVRKDLTQQQLNTIINEIYSADIAGRYTFDSIHRLFDGVELTYDPDFYKFFLENQDQILEATKSQGNFKEVKENYGLIKSYYLERGNDNPDYSDFLTYLKERKYEYEFGNEEFSRDVGIHEVSEDGYRFYENLLKETRQRHLTTIPRHEKTYTYIAPGGKEFQVMAKVLRSDDPFNLLVGEREFTDCCQKYHGAGHNCMVHASTSQNGGIFATYLIEDGKPSMLTQSWIWSNESRLCLDNVEATNVLKQNKLGRRLMEDIATFAIAESCKEMMETSRVTIEAYIEEKTKRINRSSLSEEEKKAELEKLQIVRKRQIIKEITVGEGCDDLHVKTSFPEIISESLSYGPKGYTGYRDSKEGQQHVIVSSNKEQLPIDREYQDIPIYRDDRQIKIEMGHEIRNETLRKIADIEMEAHKPEMRQYYDDETKEFKMTVPTLLANHYGCYVEDLRIMHGEDWYYVYSDNGYEIEVYDLAKKSPRIEDEGRVQTTEMSRAFEKILSDAVVLDEEGKLSKVKPIKADLREDTSYLLYLMQKQKGVIQQEGDDLAYSYTDEYNKTVITEEEQKQILSNMSEIRKNENPNLIMHRVEFRPTPKTVERILSSNVEENKEVGRKI